MSKPFYYVYIIRSCSSPDRYYTGVTQDIENRLAKHNSGQVRYTAKYKPWQIQTAIAFRNKEKAIAFERYMKSHSGRAFAKKHF